MPKTPANVPAPAMPFRKSPMDDQNAKNKSMTNKPKVMLGKGPRSYLGKHGTEQAQRDGYCKK